MMGKLKPIGAETARLAGLLTDFSQKLRAGQITLDQIEWYLNKTSAERDWLSSGASASEDKGPFVLIHTVPLTVPENFVHERQLRSFFKAYSGQFSFAFANQALTDKNFSKATQRLVPGKTYLVKFFGITRRVTSDDCLGLYKAHNGILTGAQGLTLAYQEIRGSFPVGKWTASFDEKNALLLSDGSHRVPYVSRCSSDAFELNLGDFERDWGDGSCVLVFCDCSA